MAKKLKDKISKKRTRAAGEADEDLDEGEGADDEEDDVDDDSADEEDAEDQDEDDEDEEPEVRNNLPNIIRRKNAKIAKLKKKVKEQDEDGDDDADEDDDLEEVAGRAIKKAIAPLSKQLNEQQVKMEIENFLAEPANAQFKSLKAKALRYALHPAYANVPITAIFRQLGFPGAARKAEQENGQRRETARRQSASGNSFRRAPESDVAKIGRLKFKDKEFGQLQQRLGAGETIDLSEEE